MEDNLKYTLQKGFMFGNKTNNVAIDESGVGIHIAESSITLNNMGITGSEGNKYYSIDCDSINLFNMDTEIRIEPIGISSVADGDTNFFNISSTAIILGPTNNPNVKISEEGIKFKGKSNFIPTADGNFVKMDQFAPMSEYKKKIAALEARIAALEAKYSEATA
jgi:hypothetical protein